MITNEEIYNSQTPGDLIKIFDLMAEAQREALEAYSKTILPMLLFSSLPEKDYARIKNTDINQFINGGKK